MSNQKKGIKKNSPKRYLRTGGIFLLLAGLFFSSMYGYRCLVEKVCESEVIDRMVRHDVSITTPKGTIMAEVANTKKSRELGLSGRQVMRDGEAMLFIFDVPGRYGWWTKDMHFAVDIAWINENGIVVEIERNIPPSVELNPKIYMNTSPAIYVLEMKAGESQTQGLFLGSRIKFSN